MRAEARKPKSPTVATPPSPMSFDMEATDFAVVAASSEYASNN